MAEVFLNEMRHTRIIELDFEFRSQSIPFQSCKVLAHNLRISSLEYIILYCVSYDGLSEIVFNLAVSSVTRLIIDGIENAPDGEFINILLSTLANPKLKTLALKRSGISYNGVRELVKYIKGWYLTELNLADNDEITAAGAAILFSACANSLIKRLDLGVKLPSDFLDALRNLSTAPSFPTTLV